MGFSPVRSLSTSVRVRAVAMPTPYNPGVEAALDWADVAAMLGEFEDALSWLDYIESCEGTLRPELAARRRGWLASVRTTAHAAEA